MNKSFQLLALCLSLGGCLFGGRTAAAEDAVYLALSARHENYTRAQLESSVGGADALVARLLELRHDESLPHVSIRAEKLLLEYADRENVQAALEEDVRSTSKKGLARTVALNVDRISDTAGRERLARAMVDRARKEADFLPYARQLSESKDATVRKLAKELPQ